MDAAMWANVLAGLALIIAFVSAFFTWRSVVAAKQANKLVLHSYQRELHNSFVEAYSYLKLKSEKAEFQKFLKFQEKVNTASLYVSNDLSVKLIEFHRLCSDIEEHQRRLSQTQGEQGFIKSMPENDAAQKAEKETKMDYWKLRLNANIGALLAVVTAAKELGRSIDKELKDELKLL